MAYRKKPPIVKARMHKPVYDELRMNFPDVDMSDLITIAYNTSVLRLEAGLRKGKKRKKREVDDLLPPLP